MNTEPEMPNIYSITNNNKYAINGLPEDFTSIKEIPLGFAIHKNGIYTIEVSEIVNFPEDINVYLEDKTTGITQNLNFDPVYKFFADVNSSYEGRFVLKFAEANSTSITEQTEQNPFNLFACAIEKQVQIEIEGVKPNAMIQIYDLVGKLILSERINSDGKYVFNTSSAGGTYILRYSDTEHNKVQKLLIR